MARCSMTYILEHSTANGVDHEAERLGISRSQVANELIKEALAHRRRIQRVEAAVVSGIGTVAIVLAVTLGMVV